MKAFPTEYFYDHDTKQEISPSEGMDLRDYFAAKAMQGLVTAGSYHETNLAGMVNFAYVCADFMMGRRDK